MSNQRGGYLGEERNSLFKLILMRGGMIVNADYIVTLEFYAAMQSE
jgi:hypothetical protein